MTGTKVIVNPATGRMETVDAHTEDAQAKLQRTRRELRDMLEGNTQFHEDEFKAEPPVPE